MASLEPISAAVMAYLVLGESMGHLQIAGGALVIGAIIMLQIHRAPEELAPASIRSEQSTS